MVWYNIIYDNVTVQETSTIFFIQNGIRKRTKFNEQTYVMIFLRVGVICVDVVLFFEILINFNDSLTDYKCKKVTNIKKLKKTDANIDCAKKNTSGRRFETPCLKKLSCFTFLREKFSY